MVPVNPGGRRARKTERPTGSRSRLQTTGHYLSLVAATFFEPTAKERSMHPGEATQATFGPAALLPCGLAKITNNIVVIGYYLTYIIGVLIPGRRRLKTKS